MNAFDEVAAEVGAIRQLIAMMPEENVIDLASLRSRIAVVIQKAILSAAKSATKVIRTPPPGYSTESEPNGLWWTANAEKYVEQIVKLVELAEENGVSL